MGVDAAGSNAGGGHHVPASQADDRGAAFAKLTDVYRELADVYDELADVYRAKAEGKSDAEVDGEIEETLTALGEANAAVGRAGGAFGDSPPAALNYLGDILADIQVTVARLSSDGSESESELEALGNGDRELSDQEHIDLFKRVADDAGNSEIDDLIEEIFSDDRYAGLEAFLKDSDNLDITKLLLTTPGLLEKAMAWAPEGWEGDGAPLDDPSTYRQFADWVVEERGVSLSASADTDDE
jgi:hypothetical protein